MEVWHMGQQKHITSKIKQDSASSNESDTLCRGIQNYPDCSFAVRDGGRCPSNLEECIYPQIIGFIYRGMNKILPQSVCWIIGGEKRKRKTKSLASGGQQLRRPKSSGYTNEEWAQQRRYH